MLSLLGSPSAASPEQVCKKGWEDHPHLGPTCHVGVSSPSKTGPGKDALALVPDTSP